MLANVLNNIQGDSIEEMESELREKGLFNEVMTKLNVKSKKKRIRRKVFKKQLSLITVIEEDKPENNVVVFKEVKPQQEVPDFKKLPVTFLLKLGKQYLKDELVVKHYYNSKHEEFYKNKELLLATLEGHYIDLSPSAKQDIKTNIEEQTKTKA